MHRLVPSGLYAQLGALQERGGSSNSQEGDMGRQGILCSGLMLTGLSSYVVIYCG